MQIDNLRERGKGNSLIERSIEMLIGLTKRKEVVLPVGLKRDKS